MQELSQNELDRLVSPSENTLETGEVKKLTPEEIEECREYYKKAFEDIRRDVNRQQALAWINAKDLWVGN